MYVYLIETKAIHLSAFPALFHHFDMVNHLDTVETERVLTPSMCTRSPVFAPF